MKTSLSKRLRGRMWLPRDTRERYAAVGRLVEGARSILDVGGVAGELEMFVSGSTVLTVNVEEPTDVLFDGSTLPFEDDSFGAVTSLDVIEHIGGTGRSEHLAELLRVARTLVVVTTPLGTPEHVAAERRLSDWYTAVVGEEHRFLAEHVANDLPTERELRVLAEEHESDGAAYRLAFAGDFRRVNATFADAMLARERKSPRALVSYALRHFARLDADRLAHEANPFSNRAFLILHLKQSEARRKAQ